FRRVLLIALDGMRADMLTAEGTPHLWALARRGQRFSTSRSVFPSYTRVCTASVMAGAPPEVHGVVGNALHHPSAGELPLHLDRIADLRRLVAADGSAILAPTLDQALRQAGKRFGAVSGNTPGTAALMLPDPAAGGHFVFTPHGREASQQPEAWDAVTARFGPPPEADVPLLARTAWLGKVFAEHVLAEVDPDVALLWLAEPDTALHYRGLGHADTMDALRVADAAVGLALDTLRRLGRLEETAVIAFSDHGQIACPDQIALLEEWAPLGIAYRPGPGVLATTAPGRCGGISLTAEGRRAKALPGLIAGLQARPELGMLFARDAQDGVLPYAAVGFDHPRAPDLVTVLRHDAAGGWTPAGDVPPGGGMHGGLHPGELSNLLLLALPGGEAALRDAPAGLIDIAPTALALLGVAVPDSMRGRDLSAADPAWTRRRLEAAGGGLAQYVETAEMGRARYVLEGGRID
ncbi:hypothetical protein BKE38_12420, partial [Pseudoroseomonas deserti]